MILYCLVGIQVFKLKHKFNIGQTDHIQLSSVTTKENESERRTSNTSQAEELGIHAKSSHILESQEEPVLFVPRVSHQQTAISFRHFVLMPLIFFLVLLSTWVAPTINRVSAFVRQDQTSYPLLIAVVATGSLRGFWNGVVFITIGMKGRKRNEKLVHATVKS
jgi:hypothetical protein